MKRTFAVLLLFFLFGCAAEPVCTTAESGYPPEGERSIFVYFADHDIGLHLAGALFLAELEFETEYFSLEAGGVPTFRGSGHIRFRANVIKFNPESITVNGQELNRSSQGPNFTVWQDGTVEPGDLPFEEPIYR